MKRAYSYSPYAPRQQATWRRLIKPLLRILVVLGLLVAAILSSQAQNANFGSVYNTGSLYQSSDFTNATGANFVNTGSAAIVYYAGSTFTNNGAYTASITATDRFIGPAGASGPQTLTGTTAPTFYNLTLANGPSAPFTVSNTAGADIANALTLNNGITTTVTNPVGALRLGDGAAVVGSFSTTRYVDGYVGKTGTSSFTYPLGATNQNKLTGSSNPAVGAPVYSPITLSSPGGTAIRYVAGTTPNSTSFATQSGPLQLKTVSSLEYYPIGTVGAAANSTITVPYGNFGPSAVGTPYVSDPNTLTIAAYDGTRWTNLSAQAVNSINTTAKTVTVTLPAALSTAYTALALASTSSANPLPVTLVSFGAVKKGDDGLVSWQTASEVNSAYFELQVSPDGHAWQVLTKVAAAGTSLTAHSYGFLDKLLARYGVPVIYYRLRQVDLNGQAYFSPVVSLAPDAATWQVSAYPNPYQTDLTAQLLTPEAGPVTLTLLDATGRVVLRRETTAMPGSQVFALDEARELATGAYILVVRQNEHKGSVRVVRK